MTQARPYPLDSRQSDAEGIGTYKPPAFLFNAHFETIYPSLFRKVKTVAYERERIVTPDGDFLDLDWMRQKSNRLIIISHGLEGNTSRAYVRGMARAGYDKGLDILAWNFRGCGGEVNQRLRFYHSGATDDLTTVIDHAKKDYDEIFLIGFSLGGNLTLKFLGEHQGLELISKAAVFSVPLDLHNSCIKISTPSNWIYQRRFLKSLTKKIIQKAKFFNELDITNIDKLKTLMDFDDRYTAPLHGFKSAIDYYQQCSSLYFLNNITTPTLIVNALNDPFLSATCYPIRELEQHPAITFETPRYGGHVGFSQFNKNGLYWSEERMQQFFNL